ncbi:MAG: AMP-binding protein, partial [Sulfitobacter sp.]
MGYAEVYQAAKSDPESFWLEQSKAIDWVDAPKRALFEKGNSLYEWFADAKVNGCYNAVDRHVENGRADQVAIIHDSPITGTIEKITYAQLQTRVAGLAGALVAQGVTKGDRVIIYMPMVPEALDAMLACARIGAVHSVVFGGFAAHELAVRIDDCTPKAIIAASCGLEPNRTVHYKPLLDDAIAQSAHKPDACIILQREQEICDLIEGRDLEWHAAIALGTPAECVPVEGNHPAYILYTSGTTGAPKGVVRHTAGHLVALNWTMKNIYQ